jgi:hypothetical protein
VDIGVSTLNQTNPIAGMPESDRFFRARRRELREEVRERVGYYLSILFYVESTPEWRGRNIFNVVEASRKRLEDDFIRFEVKMDEGDDVPRERRNAWYTFLRDDFLRRYPKS